ncbi:hypothetical protein [Streptomyces sp. NPDC054783]
MSASKEAPTPSARAKSVQSGKAQDLGAPPAPAPDPKPAEMSGAPAAVTTPRPLSARELTALQRKLRAKYH